MILPGETEAGTAGTQPCRGITRRAHRADSQQRGSFSPLALSSEWKQPSDDRPPCLENPRPAGVEPTLTENAASPFPAEPAHFSYVQVTFKLFDRTGNVVGTTLANQNNLNAGETRRFVATDAFPAHHYRFDEITAY